MAATNLDHAKRLAAGLIGRLGGGGERVAVVTLGGEAAAVFDGFTYDLDAAAEAAGAVPQTSAGGDLAGALRAAADLAEGADAPVKNLHLVTDATAGAFPEDGPLAEAATAAAEVFSNVTHHDVSAATPWNHAVTGLGAEGGLLRAGFDTTLAADVRGYGSAPADRRTAAARVLIDGSPVGGGGGERSVEPSPEAPPLRVTPDLSAGGDAHGHGGAAPRRRFADRRPAAGGAGRRGPAAGADRRGRARDGGARGQRGVPRRGAGPAGRRRVRNHGRQRELRHDRAD